MVEAPADAKQTARQEPAEILSVVAVQRAIDVDDGAPRRVVAMIFYREITPLAR